MSHFPEEEEKVTITQPTYLVESCQKLGRFMVAARDLRKGEIIFEEYPIAIAPQKNSELICPGCFSGKVGSECPKCRWPICGENCPFLSRHQGNECAALLEENASSRSPEEWIALQDLLMIFRCLNTKLCSKEKWDVLQDMESNWDKWSASPLYKTAQDVIHRLRTHFRLTEEDYPMSEILKVLAILDTNAYEVKMPDVNIQGCYRFASLPEHSCIPNALKTTSSSTFLLTMRALTDLPKGTHIMTTYSDTLWPTFQRQKHVQWSKFFVCNCPRCNDPSELGSFISSILCPRCPFTSFSPLLPILNPLSVSDVIEEEEEGGDENLWKTLSKDYQCQKCSAIFRDKCCESIVISAERHLQELDMNRSTSTEDGGEEDSRLAIFESWLDKWTVFPAARHSAPIHENGSRPLPNTIRSQRNTVKYSHDKLLYLHPQHALVLDAMHTVFLLYSANSHDLEALLRKSALGIQMLKATANLFKGISMFRGTVMYELALTKASIFAHIVDNDKEETEETNNGSEASLKTLSKEIIWLFTEALEHLQYESPDQPEGKLFTKGLQQLEHLKNFLREYVPDLLL